MRLAALLLCLSLATLAATAVASRHGERSVRSAQSKPLPRVVRLARADAAKRRDVRVGEVKVVRVTKKTWPNGCLGLESAGQFCTQALVEGYRATFSVRAKRMHYRTDRTSRFRLEPG